MRAMRRPDRPGRQQVLRGVAVLASALLLATPGRAGSPASPPPSGGLGAQPMTQQLTLAAGAEGEAHIVLLNESSEAPGPVQLAVADLDSAGMVRPAASTPHTLVGVLSLPAQEIVLAPRERRTIAVRVRGDGHPRFGAVIASAVTPGPNPIAFARLVLQLIVAVPGNVREHPAVELAVSPDGQITLRMENPGQTLCVGRGALFLLRPDGAFLGRLDIPEFAMLPGGAATVVLRWPAPLVSGTVARAALSLDGGDAPYVASSQVP